MTRLSPEARESAMKRLEEMTAGWSGTMVRTLSIACGSASSQEYPSANLNELSRISDERMYAAKAEYYQASGRDRRRGRPA